MQVTHGCFIYAKLNPWNDRFFSWLLSRQWHHLTADPLPGERYRKTHCLCKDMNRGSAVCICVCLAGVEGLRLSGECGMDRSYGGINLKLALLYACECWLPKALWVLPIDSQFLWWWMKTFKGKTAIGHKVCDLLRFSSPSLLFFLHPTPSCFTKPPLWH